MQVIQIDIIPSKKTLKLNRDVWQKYLIMFLRHVYIFNSQESHWCYLNIIVFD